jgi:preprotein translocase subunit SecB
MDKTKSPGISIESVHLLECVVGDVKPEVTLNFALGISHFSRTLVSDGKVLAVKVSFDLMRGIENPPCKFQCTFMATYTRSSEPNMNWDEFQDHIAVAHIIPYVREFVSNITARLPLSVLMVPPVNTSALVEEYRQLTLQKAVPATV